MGLTLSAPRLTLALEENAMDSLLQGVSRILVHQFSNSKELKYAVLSIAQAAELFLKARLAKEHQLLIFEDPGKVGDQARTVDLESCLRRLLAAKVDITEKQQQQIRSLQRTRNRLQHHAIDDLSESIVHELGQVVMFLESFLEAHMKIILRDQLSETEYLRLRQAVASYDDALQIAGQLLERDFAQLSSERQEATERHRCIECNQLTVLYPDPSSTPFSPNVVECYFCRERFDVTACPNCGGTGCEHCTGMWS